MQTVRACCRSFAAIGAALLSFSLHAAPGGNWNTIEHTAYPAPQNVMAALDGSKVKLAWDGIAWPAEGWATEIDGKTVPTDFTYGIECRVKTTGTDTWSDWWTRTTRGRLDDNGAFVSRWEIEDEVESGKTYQYRIRCYSYIEPDNPQDLTNPTRDGYFSDYSETVTAYKTLDKLEIALPDNSYHPLQGMLAINLTYAYASSRADEGEEPLYFTFKAIEVPYPEPGTTPEAPVAGGGKPYARRDGTPLTVNTLDTCPPDSLDWERVDPTNFTLTATSGTVEYPGEIAWYVYDDLKNYYHTNVTIWVQGWAKPETAGGAPRLVLDEAIGNVTVDTRGVTATPQPDQGSVVLSWPKVPDAAKYQVWRSDIEEGSPYERLEEFGSQAATVSFTDMSVASGTRYKYKIVALDANGGELDSGTTTGYSRLDVFSTADQSLYSVQPQTPWNGKVDIVVRYYSARVERNDGIPHFKLIAENYETGEVLTVKTLTRADGEVINPDDFTLEDEQNLEQRLVWDAGADLGETLVERLRLTVDCVRVEPYYEGDPVTAWTGSPAKYKENVRLDTRNPRIRKLGQGTHAWVDLDWFPGATKADLYCNGTLIHTTTDEYTRKKTLDNAELNIWGTNELKVVTDTGVTWTGGIAYPSFGFTVSEGNEDGITLTWNTVDDEAVGGYQIRRRVKGSTADFETVKTVGPDVTTYTDTTADEAGAYEYTVVPRRTWDADVGPVPAAKRGYRSLDKIEIVQARQLYPWTRQVALDVSYVSGRDESTDGVVTYKLEAALADGTAIPISNENLRLETVDGFALDPANIPFGSKSLPSGTMTRLWWNAPADLGTVQVSSALIEGIVLRIVPTLADDAPEGAVAAPAPSVKDGLTVDLRTERPVQVGEKIPVVWEWMRTDTRDETRDYTVILAYPQGARECVALMPEERTGEGEVEVTDDMWTCFNLVKRELNDGADDAQKIELTSEVLFKLPVEPVANVQATRGNADALTVTWDAVPHASAYEVKVERWDVAINRTEETVTVDTNQFVDDQLPQPGLGRYTVTAVYPNSMKGAASEATVGYAVLDTMQILGVSTRWPWNGKVDLDVEYKTVRPRFRELFGKDDLPYPTNVTLAATAADGTAIAVTTLEKEPAVDKNYTVNRKAVENGTAIFSGSGWLRLVWDADKDTQNNLLATNATLTLTASDDYSSLTDSCTVDINTTKPVAIPLPEESEENDRKIAFPWAARWADEAERSLNMQDGTDLEIVTVTRYGTVTNVVETQTQLSDEGGVYTWHPGNYYGVLIVEGSFSNRATAASSTYRSKFLRSVATPVTVERVPGQNALDIRWTFSADCTYYQIIRREVYADGTRSPWQNMAPLSGPWYRDIGVVGGKTYEYAACPLYPDPDTHDYIMADPVVWTAGRVAVTVNFDALGPWADGGQSVVTQFLDDGYGALPTATRAGYKLVGWFDGVTNGAPEAVEGSNLLAHVNHTLYAKWETDWGGEAAFTYEPIDATTVRIKGLKGAAPDNGCFVLPDSIDGYLVTEIGASAFAYSPVALGAVTFPVFCTNVADYAFGSAKGVTALTFTQPRRADRPSETATLSLGEGAFTGTAVTEVTIPAYVDYLGEGLFANCQALGVVTVLGTPATGGSSVFRRAARATADKKLTLRADAAWVAANGFDVKDNIEPTAIAPTVQSVRVTGLSGAAKTWTLTLAVTLADGEWSAFDARAVRVDFAETLGATPTRLVPTKAEKPSEGVVTVTVELSAESPSGFFWVVIGE